MSQIKILQKASKKRKRPKPAVLRKKIAELPSSYSNTIIQISSKVSCANDALALIYLSSFFKYWETDKLISSIAQKCFLSNYEGKWATVQEFLETEVPTPEEFEKIYISKFGTNDFYGNFLYRSYRLSLGLKIQDLQKPNRNPVKRPVYRRGYKDKGSLRLPSENHGLRPSSSEDSERIDRRHLITHPLLGKEKLADEDDANFTHLERSDNYDYNSGSY